MKHKNSVCFMLMLAVALGIFAGCAGFRLRGEVQSGRKELLWGNPQKALGHFQRAAEIDPHYVIDFTDFEQGVWTYVGRAHYKMRELQKAREALERALRQHPKDHLAHTYLAAVLLRQGRGESGMREAKIGLKSLGNWLQYMDRYDPEGFYWDPGLRLENRITELLGMIDGRDVGRDVSAAEMISSLEWLGKEFEEEIDRVKEDKRQDIDDDDDDGGGQT